MLYALRKCGAKQSAHRERSVEIGLITEPAAGFGMTTPVGRMFRRLEGLFCVYKPPGVHWKLVRDTVETNLLKGLNSASVQPLPDTVRFLAPPVGGNRAPAVLTATRVPVLAEHPLARGPEVQRIRVGVGHRLDAFSSGVLVLAVGNGNKTLNDLYSSRVTRDYTVEGELGSATDDFSHEGRVIERTTFGHVTPDKLDRVVAMLEGANQKALLMYSKVDLRSQEAYELAVQGLLGPEGKSTPILTGLRCVHFQPPHFTLKIRCLNETQRYLRKIVHEIGLELRSTAVCRAVRRTRDGPFGLQQALTRGHWAAADVMAAVKDYHTSKKKHKKKHGGGDGHAEARRVQT